MPSVHSHVCESVDGESHALYKGDIMQDPKRQAKAGAAFGSPTIHAQPSYHRDIAEGDIVALQKAVDAKKPKDFRLAPVSEAGW